MADTINAILAQRTALGGGKYTDFVPGSEVGLGSVFGPGTLDAPGIQAAMNLAGLAGGGIVQLPAGRILLASTLVPVSGVKLRGIAPQLVYNTIPDSGLTTLVGSLGGTVLVPTGAFDAIAWNTGALAAPSTQTAFSQLALTNISFEDLGFSGDLGGTSAIHAGGTNNPSCWYSQFKGLFATGFTVAGSAAFSIANYQHCVFDENYTFGCAWGHLHQIDVAASFLAPGNSRYGGIFCCNPTGSGTTATVARNITFITTATTGGGAINNEFKFDRIQSNRFGGSTNTQAATMTNTQATFTVTDGTKYPVGMPVTFSATANGFTINKVYFVVSNATNTISCSATYGGTAITATGSTAVNITSTGFPCFEMIALAGSTQTNIVIDNLDVEGLGTIGAFFQNCNGVNIQISQVPSTAQAPISVCYRGCQNKLLIAPQNVSTDDDANAVGSASMFFGGKFGTSVGYQGMGLWIDSVSGRSTFSMGSTFDTAAQGCLTYDPSIAGGTIRCITLGFSNLASKTITGASSSITALNQAVINNTPASTTTLLAIVAGLDDCELAIVNTSAGSQTYTTAGELINNVAGRTSFVLNAGASIHLIVRNSQWWILGASSAMAAGVVSAPS